MTEIVSPTASYEGTSRPPKKLLKKNPEEECKNEIVATSA